MGYRGAWTRVTSDRIFHFLKADVRAAPRVQWPADRLKQRPAAVVAVDREQREEHRDADVGHVIGQPQGLLGAVDAHLRLGRIVFSEASIR